MDNDQHKMYYNIFIRIIIYLVHTDLIGRIPKEVFILLKAERSYGSTSDVLQNQKNQINSI